MPLSNLYSNSTGRAQLYRHSSFSVGRRKTVFAGERLLVEGKVSVALETSNCAEVCEFPSGKCWIVSFCWAGRLNFGEELDMYARG